MTKVFDVLFGRLYHHYTEYATIEDTKGLYSDEIIFVDAPDRCEAGDVYIANETGDLRFIHPGYWDPTMPETYGSADEFRTIERGFINRIADIDLLDALNHVFDGDTDHDWSAWARMLRDYKQAVEDTASDPGYPLNVAYPEYPTRPWDDEPQ